MGRKALIDEKHEIIKAHILDPDNSPLPEHLKEQMDRIVGMSKLLDKNPTIKHAVALHRSRFPGISKETAYRDARLARKVYNSMHEFNFDFWLNWLLNDISENIRRCRKRDTPQNRQIIASEHANLLKAIGDRPQEIPDPRRNEKHQFYLMVNMNNENYKIDLSALDKLPKEILSEFNKAISGGHEIDEQEAIEIMNT